MSAASQLSTSLYRFRHAIVLIFYFAVATYAHVRRRAVRKKKRAERLAREEAELLRQKQFKDQS